MLWKVGIASIDFYERALESKQIDFLKLQEELKEEAQGKQDKIDEVMDLFVVNALEHEIARLKYQQAVREEVDKLRPYFLTTKKFVHFLKRIERIEQLISSGIDSRAHKCFIFLLKSI